MIIAPGSIGIDVSKSYLDVFDATLGTTERIANTAEAIAELVGRWRGREVFVIFEATGRYDIRLRTGLAEANIACARVNPARARDFARAAGLLAKTDVLDARMLAAFGQCLKPPATTPLDRERDRLVLAHRRRDQLVHLRQSERTRLTECHDAQLRADIEAHLAWLDRDIIAWNEEIQRRIRAGRKLEAAWRRLRSIPGIGPVCATTLVALVPELGSLSPKTAAALAGLAPFAVESGRWRGKRRIHGGRKRVRDALYMAAVTAARCHPRFKAFYQRLRAAGKPAKSAIIALARKLLVVANALLRDRCQFSPV